MTKRTRFSRQADRYQIWRQASASAAANASELPQAELTQIALAKVIVEVDKIGIEQSAFRASKQLFSQRLQTLIDQGDKLTTVLKTIVKQHYGSGSDKSGGVRNPAVPGSPQGHGGAAHDSYPRSRHAGPLSRYAGPHPHPAR
ncbi:MAG TPA: hypothetical protein VGQ28_17880 [Thermoanaerobaculia bacterium]|nr:hypothetical protein [Thermoanaerobaculia bacterium]